MGKDTEPLTTTVHLDGHAAATGSNTSECVIFAAADACVITGIDMMVTTTVTVQETNYGTATVYAKGLTGSGTTSVATRVTNAAGGGALTAYNANAMTLSTTAASLELAATETLTASWVEAAASLDIVGAVFAVHYAQGTGAGA